MSQSLPVPLSGPSEAGLVPLATDDGVPSICRTLSRAVGCCLGLWGAVLPQAYLDLAPSHSGLHLCLQRQTWIQSRAQPVPLRSWMSCFPYERGTFSSCKLQILPAPFTGWLGGGMGRGSSAEPQDTETDLMTFLHSLRNQDSVRCTGEKSSHCRQRMP